MSEYRQIDGKLKLLERQTEFLYPIEVWLVNDQVNRNKWQYPSVVQKKDLFAGTPILVAYVGNRVGDGHNFQTRRDANGEEYASFVSADSERIVGALSEKPDDIRVEDVNGVKWLVAKGFLWKWYAAELVSKIETDSLRGREMSVSIETLVTESHMNGDVEVMDEFLILGTTILGDGVAPAVENARIKALQEIESEFKILKVRAASYQECGDEGHQCGDDGCLCGDGGHQCEDADDDGNEPDEEEQEDPEDKTDEPESEEPDDTDDVDDTDDEDEDESEEEQPVEFSEESCGSSVITTNKETRGMAYKKRDLAELQKLFTGYKVIAAEMVNDTVHVCLMSSEDGGIYKYAMPSSERTIVPERIERVAVNASMPIDDEHSVELDVYSMTESLAERVVSLSALVTSTQKELEDAQNTITAMRDAENARRLSAAKSVAESALKSFNANREGKVEHNAIDTILADIEANKYTERVNEENVWIGDKEVEDAVLAVCAKAVMQMDARAAQDKKKVSGWTAFTMHGNHDDGSVDALLSKWGID